MDAARRKGHGALIEDGARGGFESREPAVAVDRGGRPPGVIAGDIASGFVLLLESTPEASPSARPLA